MCAGLEGSEVLDDVLMVQRFEQVYLPHHILQVVLRYACEGDLLDSHGVTSGVVNALVNLAICSTAKLLPNEKPVTKDGLLAAA